MRRGYPGWRMVWALAVTETIYGVLYYSFAAFLLPMQHSLGSSPTMLTGAFSVSVLVSGAAAVPAGPASAPPTWTRWSTWRRTARSPSEISASGCR